MNIEYRPDGYLILKYELHSFDIQEIKFFKKFEYRISIWWIFDIQYRISIW